MFAHRRSVFKSIVREDDYADDAGLVRDDAQRTSKRHRGAGAGDDALFLVQAAAELVGLVVVDFDESVVLLGEEE